MSLQRQRLLDVAQAEGRLTSVVGAVFDRYGAVWAGGAGQAPGLDGQYRIGSITKSMTAVLVVQARDAGLLDLDDPLAAHLGDVGYGDVTVRDALAHSSGIQSEPRGPWWERTRGGDFTALALANDGSGRVAPAGAWFHYSNLGYGLLGEVVARRFGTSWRALVSERLLQPLGMRATSYLPRPGAQPGWSVDHFTGVRVHEPLTDTGAMAPAGQLWSTLADLVTWGQVLGGARPDVLATSSLEEMKRPVTADYGLGLMLGIHPGGRLVGHNGSMPGFLAALHVDPDSGIGAAVLANATTGIDPRDLAVSLIEGDPDAEDTRPAPWRPTVAVPSEAQGVPGLWFWGNTAYDVRWHNDGIETRAMARGNVVTDRFELVQGTLVGVLGYHRGERLDVVRRPDGSVHHLECATFVYTRTPYDPEVEIPGGHPR
ncbi:beta-lactamase family protein [Nocardioides cavernae]|uniref:Beta-lactamase family protein n=1 Tax=Nocardioides cavernae TaxID=1921566 RepID=A0ABR8NC46_9ACTN|nr:serine hydrolase domain-containing protein [Nocardioides cavernae]MBD3925707.1 beta-lactamase family protein [Nocardioides cavernae]MBM7513292.1 CubicO group peptidase (beta-lactamase class C family) [Nocardioides cavernae]